MEEVLEDFEGTILLFPMTGILLENLQKGYVNWRMESSIALMVTMKSIEPGSVTMPRERKIQNRFLNLLKRRKILHKNSVQRLLRKLLNLEKEINLIEQRLAEIEDEMEVHATDYERLEELLHENRPWRKT